MKAAVSQDFFYIALCRQAFCHAGCVSVLPALLFRVYWYANPWPALCDGSNIDFACSSVSSIPKTSL